MPLLPLEPSRYPDDLLQSGSPRADASAWWWVLQTRPRTEKALARQLFQRGLAFFLPLYAKQWRRRGRWLRSYVPLFPGYVFLYGDPLARLTALQTHLVARVLPVEDQCQLHTDLVQVEALLRAELPVTPADRLPPGSRVTITAGPLAGLEGKVLRRGKQWKLVIEVRLLQRGVAVEIESWMLQPALEAG